MGGCPPLHHWQCCRSRVLVLCVVALQGVLWQTGAAAPLCGDTCAVDVRPVCGADGRSYSNGCVASCAGVAVASQGYCKGDRVRFKQAASSSSNSFLGSIPWRLAKESGHVITAEVMNKFAAEGFVYRGRVDLASLNQRTGYKAGTAHRHGPKEHSSMFQQEASTTASQQAAARPTSVRPTSSAAADSAATPAVAAEGRVAEANPRAPAKAPAAVAAKPAESATVLDVAVVRVDNAGNLYTKTYTYDSSRFSQMAYPPFNPAGAALVESKVATGTKAAGAAPTAQQQQRAAKAATEPPAAGAAAPSPATKAVPAPAASGSRQPGGVSGRAAAGSTGAVVRSPVGAERKASSSLPVSSAPATAAAGRQPLPEGAARLDLQQGDVQGSRAREQMQEQGLQGNTTSSSANATAAANSTRAVDSTPAAAEQLLQQQRAAAADLATPQQPLRQKLSAPAPLQLEKEALSRSQQQQLPLSGAAQAKRPDYMTSPVRQGMSELAKDAVRQTISSGGSSPGSSSSSSSGKVADAVKKEQLIPELAAVDPKGFEDTAPPLPKGAPSSSGSSSSSAASKTAPPAAAVAAPVQSNGLKLEGAQQQQQQQQPKGPQQMSAPTVVAEEAEPAAAAAPAAAGSKADPAKPEAAPAAPAAAAATKPVAAATQPEAAAVAAAEAAPAAPTTKPATPPAAAAGAAAPTKAEAAAGPSAAAPGASSSSGTARSTPPQAATPALPNSSSSSSSKDGKVLPGAASPQPAKALPPCNSEGLYCRDKILATSPMFGRQPPAGKFMDQAWLAGKARISGVKMFYNTTSGCLRGLQLTYKPNAAAAAGSNGGSSSGLGSGPVVKLLGSGYLHADIAVKELRLKEGEIVGKAEVWDPKCINYLRLFTSKGQKVSVGRIDPGAEGQARNVTKNRDNGLLLAVKGWQDPPKKHGATAKKPAGSSPGVLKQLQFVWGAPWCDQKCTPVHSGAAGPAAGSSEEPATLIAESGSLPSAGHQRALLQQQQQQQQQLSDSIERRLDAQVQSEQTHQQQHLHAAAAAAAAEAQLPPLLVQDAEGAGEQPPHQQQQLRRLAATAAAAEGDAWATAELEATAAMQQGALGATPTTSSSSSSNGSVVVPASVHRMLSVIKPDNRLPCPTRTFPFYAMGQIKAKASDGGFVCSGGLIGSNRVLTAGHCVWDDRNAQGPFRDLRFAPGQWKVGSKVESPFGFVDWDYVTLFDTYINDPDGEGLPFDVAVITLNKPVGTELGWLGVRADAPPCRATPLTLNLAGYPGEDPENPRVGGWAGGCFYDKCDVSYSCSVSITNHTCDSYVGQSGAPMFDDEHYVRAVHTLGVLPGFSNTNGAITIQKFMLDNVMGYWRDTVGYSVSRTGAQARGVESGNKRGKRRRSH